MLWLNVNGLDNGVDVAVLLISLGHLMRQQRTAFNFVEFDWCRQASSMGFVQVHTEATAVIDMVIGKHSAVIGATEATVAIDMEIGKAMPSLDVS